MPLLNLRDLHVDVRGVPILRGVDLVLEPGRTLGVVGESGCGKTMTALAVMGMLPDGAKLRAAEATLDGRDLAALRPAEWRQLRGRTVAMVMQDPFTSLNPMMRVGPQIAEVLVHQHGYPAARADAETLELLGKVGVPLPERAARRFPHQLSGGQRQRVVIAIAYAARPKLLIADEPTTALDVTLQAQILQLLVDLQASVGTSILLISHDIGVIGSISDEVAVFYAGTVVERGPVEAVLHDPAHPYTRLLLAALPTPQAERLASIPGQPPDFRALPPGCAFAPRCPDRFEPCDTRPPSAPLPGGRTCACWMAAAQPSSVS